MRFCICMRLLNNVKTLFLRFFILTDRQEFKIRIHILLAYWVHMYIHQPTCSHISEVVSAFNKVTKRYSHASLYAMTHPPFIYMFVLNYSNTIGKYAYTQTHRHTHTHTHTHTYIYIIFGSFIIFVFLTWKSRVYLW